MTLKNFTSATLRQRIILGLAFKLIMILCRSADLHRIFSGTLKSGMQVFNATKKKHERIGVS